MEKMKENEGAKGEGIADSNIRGNLATAVGFLEKQNEECGIRDHQGHYGEEKGEMSEKKSKREMREEY
jgi:hypothetical protein